MHDLPDLVDPLDQSPLTIERGSDGAYLAIASQSRSYRVTNGHANMIPTPLPPALAQRQALWDQLQHNGDFSYQADPILNLSTDDGFARAFQNATKISGRVLDIGCGPQRHSPRYLQGAGIGPIIGVDPLAGAPNRDFPFVIGISEALPFANASFDAVVFCRSLDHVLDTSTALHQAMRVLRDGGKLCIVMDLVEQQRKSWPARLGHLVTRGAAQFFKSMRAHGLPQAVRYIWALARLKVPAGAEDMFHMHFPSPSEVADILNRAGAKSVAFHNLSPEETICIAIK